MTGVAASAAPEAPWAAVDVDHEQVLAEVDRQFPGVTAYYGEYTGSWWALVGNRLLEARTPREFYEIIATAISSSRPARPRSPQARAPGTDADTAWDLPTPKRHERLAAAHSPKHASTAPREVHRQPRPRRKARGVLRRLFGGEVGGGSGLSGEAELGRLRRA